MIYFQTYIIYYPILAFFQSYDRNQKLHAKFKSSIKLQMIIT